MVVRARGRWLSARIETRTKGIIKPLDTPYFAKTLVKVGQMIICLVVVEAIFPSTLLPAVGAVANDRCMSAWGDGSNASLGYQFKVKQLAENQRLCLRYWISSDNALPCEQYAVLVNYFDLRSVSLKHQLALQEKKNYVCITEEYPLLHILFQQNTIDFVWGGNEYRRGNFMCGSAIDTFFNIFHRHSPSDSASAPTNLCAGLVDQTASSLAGDATTATTHAFYTTAATFTTVVTTMAQIASSSTTYALGEYSGSEYTSMSTNTTMIASEQKKNSNSFTYKMIAIGVLGTFAFSMLAYVGFHGIKKRLRATDRAPDTVRRRNQARRSSRSTGLLNHVVMVPLQKLSTPVENKKSAC